MCPHLLKKNTYTVIYHIPNVQQSISPGSCPIPLARACAVGRSIRAANFFSKMMGGKSEEHPQNHHHLGDLAHILGIIVPIELTNIFQRGG